VAGLSLCRRRLGGGGAAWVVWVYELFLTGEGIDHHSGGCPITDPLTVSPFTPSNYLIIVPDLQCSSNAAAVRARMYASMFL